MIKETIKELNRAMNNNEISFDCVRNLLQQLSKITGKNYEILSRRVVYIENHKIHDAWVNS